MRKPASLRAAIIARDPDLAADPARLLIWLETGKVRSVGGGAAHFEWEYTLNVVVSGFAKDPAILSLAINLWLQRNQPDLLTAKNGYTFEADVLNDQEVDVQFTLRLSEAVLAHPQPDGGVVLEYLEEPKLFDDEDEIGGTLRELWRNADPDEPILPIET